jgi:uncharacterized protein (DUF2062 family)
MSGFFLTLRERLREQMPTPDQLARHRWLRPIAHRLCEHGLWHAKTESVARGVAIGLFWAFVVPFAQVLFAAAHCVWWRANIPVAAAITFITNPFTIGGWLYLAYQVGTHFVPAAPTTANRPMPTTVGQPRACRRASQPSAPASSARAGTKCVPTW